jgi:hypothetical protein
VLGLGGRFRSSAARVVLVVAIFLLVVVIVVAADLLNGKGLRPLADRLVVGAADEDAVLLLVAELGADFP